MRLVPVAVALLAALLAGGSWSGTGAAKVVPVCKAGQRSSPAHPCRRPPPCRAGEKRTAAHPCVRPPRCKPGERSTPARPCVRPAATTTTTAAGAGGGGSISVSGGSAGAGLQADGCPPGTTIPQGVAAGDGDEDNQGFPDDGDGCF